MRKNNCLKIKDHSTSKIVPLEFNKVQRILHAAIKKQKLWPLRLSAFILLLFFGVSTAFAAGSCTVSTARDGGLVEVEWVWTSDASGDVSGEGAKKVSGTVVGVKFVPDTGGTAPTDLYDVTMLDAAGVDVLHGVGANLPQSATSTDNYRTPFTADGAYVILIGKTLTPLVAAGGNAKGGKIRMIFRK